VSQISGDDIHWIVNDNGELGVRVGDTFAFLYKGRSLEYDADTRDDGTRMRWRPVYKREFGECQHPVGFPPNGSAFRYASGDPGDWLDLPLKVRMEPAPAPELPAVAAQPVPMLLHCPWCQARHYDEGEFATRPHHTHSCQNCGMTWRPAVVATVGVLFLPGFKT
jgi:hypothetical protein